MPRQLSNQAKAALYSQQTSEVLILLLTIDHETLAQPIRLSSDPTETLPDAGVLGTLSRDEEYIYLPFSVNLPNQDESGIARASISIDNIDRRIIQAVRDARGSQLDITIELILASQPDDPEISITGFRLERVQYDALTVTGEISIEYFDLEPFPSKRFTPADFPGLF